MRILLVNDHPPGPTGGAEVHVGRLREALLGAGDEVDLFVADGEHRGLAKAFDLWDPTARRRLQDRLATFSPDVVHYHNVLNVLSTSVLGLGVPAVLTVHDPRLLGIRFGLDHGRSGLRPDVALRDAKNRLGRHRARRNVQATIAPSVELAASLADAGFPDVHHVPNFAPLLEAGPPGDDIVFVGHLMEHKGPHLALGAFVAIADRHRSSRLRFVGDGPMRQQLESSARAAGLGSRVVMEGVLAPEAVPDVLRSAALVTVPSLSVEGGGPTLAVIEAMCSGRPVVVSDRPGVREGVDDEVGSVVPADDVDALAAAIDRLLGDRDVLRRRGAAALERARTTWAPGVAVPRFHAIYRTVSHGAG
jgi:glycosyltransferase involved in cell wall biosynthesis